MKKNLSQNMQIKTCSLRTKAQEQQIIILKLLQTRENPRNTDNRRVAITGKCNQRRREIYSQTNSYYVTDAYENKQQRIGKYARLAANPRSTDD